MTQDRNSTAVIRRAVVLMAWAGLLGCGQWAWADAPVEQPTASLAQAETTQDKPADPVKDEATADETPTTTPEAAEPRKPLMRIFEAMGVADEMDDIGLNAYGWVETSFTGVFTGPGSSKKGLPLRVYEARKPDNAKMNQLALVLERTYDSTKSVDFGFRVDSIYGADSRVNASVGLLDHETHTHSFDLAQFYAQMWIKTAENQGLELKFGKWYTTVGAEVIPSPSNWLPTRTMLFGFGPFTHTGLLATYYLDNWNFHLGISRGWDQFKDNNHGASWHAGFGYAGKEMVGESPRHKLGFNYIGGPEEVLNEYGGQNRHVWNMVWTYLWNEKLTQVVDTYYTWEDDMPGSENERGTVRRRDNAWYGIAYMLNYKINDNFNTTGRFEWFGDNYGARTGFRGNFFSLTAGLGYIPFPNDPWLSGLSIRPELRWDFSDNNDPFVDQGQQFTGTLSVVYAF